MTILQMEYFVTVAELDLTLIDRSNKKRISLTKAGEQLCASWKMILQQYYNSVEEAMILAGKKKKRPLI